jgi:mannosylglycerate synthase
VLLRLDWTDRQEDLLGLLPPEVASGMRALRDYPSVAFMDEDAWYATYRRLLLTYDPLDDDWQKLLFRLWAARVLDYTFTQALRGHVAAIEYLEGMIGRAAHS